MFWVPKCEITKTVSVKVCKFIVSQRGMEIIQRLSHDFVFSLSYFFFLWPLFSRTEKILTCYLKPNIYFIVILIWCSFFFLNISFSGFVTYPGCFGSEFVGTLTCSQQWSNLLKKTFRLISRDFESAVKCENFWLECKNLGKSICIRQ